MTSHCCIILTFANITAKTWKGFVDEHGNTPVIGSNRPKETTKGNDVSRFCNTQDKHVAKDSAVMFPQQVTFALHLLLRLKIPYPSDRHQVIYDSCMYEMLKIACETGYTTDAKLDKRIFANNVVTTANHVFSRTCVETLCLQLLYNLRKEWSSTPGRAKTTTHDDEVNLLTNYNIVMFQLEQSDAILAKQLFPSEFTFSLHS